MGIQSVENGGHTLVGLAKLSDVRCDGQSLIERAFELARNVSVSNGLQNSAVRSLRNLRL